MAITSVWDNEEKTIVRVTYTGSRTWPEWQEAMEELQSMLDSVEHRLDIINDLTDMEPPPDIMSRMGEIAESPIYAHESVRYVIVIGAAEYVERLVGLFTTLYPEVAPRVIRAESMEDARALIGTRPRTDQ